jgi:hypothetical protein
MAKDKRYTTAKNLITAGYIKSFREIFDTIPKSVVARDLGVNSMRFNKLIKHVDRFSLKDLFLIASFFEVEERVMIDLIYQQYLIDKESKT